MCAGKNRIQTDFHENCEITINLCDNAFSSLFYIEQNAEINIYCIQESISKSASTYI